MSKRTYFAIVLDRSGSMKYSRTATIKGFNDQVEALKEEVKQGSEVYVTFYTFNHEVESHYTNQSINYLMPLTDEDYVTSGDTAMFEAMGTAIDKFVETTETDDPDNAYFVWLVSDGRNNRFGAWSPERLSQRMRELQDTKRWTFSYLGANHDLSKVAKALSIPAGNMASYTSDNEGTAYAWQASNRSISGYFKARRTKGIASMENLYSSDGIADLTVKKGKEQT